MTTTAEQTLSGLRLWQVSLAAILGEMNGCYHHCLALHAMDDEDRRSGWKTSLSRDWEIENEKDLEETLEFLRTGHNKGFQESMSRWQGATEDAIEQHLLAVKDESYVAKLRLVVQHRHSLKHCGIYAWDAGRAAHIIRNAFYIDIISEERAWELLDQVTSEVYPAFNSWQQFGLSYTVGRAYWSATNLDEYFCQDRFSHLQSIANNPEHPWNYLPWETAGLHN